MITEAVLSQLAQFDTPTICNVIELFDVRPDNTGYMDNRIQAVFPDMPAIVGFASTATARTAVAPRSGESYTRVAGQVERFQELSGPPVVVFQDLDNPPAAATFGEIMCTTYKAFGAIGLVTNGPGRDIDQVRRLGFPIFTNGTCCSHGYFHILETHVSVHVGGITVNPDDLIHADLNGVTTIPKDIAADVASACSEFVAAEQIIIDAMRSGNATLALLREAQAEKDARVDSLRALVTRKP
jgi:4-hydroxy-4-methyl-2-oxoglutarate aldolase